METVNAQLFIEISVICPYCGALDDKFEELREHLEDDHRASDIDVEVVCSECEKMYIVKNINF